jgi:hypothetical protein
MLSDVEYISAKHKKIASIHNKMLLNNKKAYQYIKQTAKPDEDMSRYEMIELYKGQFLMN